MTPYLYEEYLYRHWESIFKYDLLSLVVHKILYTNVKVKLYYGRFSLWLLFIDIFLIDWLSFPNISRIHPLKGNYLYYIKLLMGSPYTSVLLVCSSVWKSFQSCHEVWSFKWISQSFKCSWKWSFYDECNVIKKKILVVIDRLLTVGKKYLHRSMTFLQRTNWFLHFLV